jgi:hypothetical protein
MKRTIFLLLMVFSLILLGCSLPYPDSQPPFSEGQGAVLVRHGGYLYKLGGVDVEGIATAKAYMACITDTPLQWTETTALPAARAFGAAFTAGNMMYYLGGTDGLSDSSSIFYTYIDPIDGTLGFPASSRFWETNPVPLPMRLSHFGYALYDGRVFLLGGVSDSRKVDAIFEARVHGNALVGQWYRSPQELPSGLSDMGAAVSCRPGIEDALVVAGGIDDDGRVLGKVAAFPLGPKGFIGERKDLPDLPKALAALVLLGNGPDLMVFGGYGEDFSKSESVYVYSAVTALWQQEAGQAAPAEGPSVARISKKLWYQGQKGELAGFQGIGTLESDSLYPDIPNVFPGSGFIASNSSIFSSVEPGATMKYRVKSSLSWLDSPSPFKITENVEYEFSESNSLEKMVALRNYQVRNLGFLFSVSGTLAVQEHDAALGTIYMNSFINDAASAPLASVWVKLRLSADENLVLAWSDHTTAAGFYTGQIRLSLFEDDFNTEALDGFGHAVSNRLATQGSISLSLQKGTYYFLLEDMENVGGRSLGISVGQL